MKTLKRTLSALIAIAAVITLLSATVSAAHAEDRNEQMLNDWTVPFSDIPLRAWFNEAVHYCWEHRYMSGTSPTTFEPYSTVTRAMTVTVLWRLAGAPKYDGFIFYPFLDTALNIWYSDALAWATENSLTAGVSPGRFGPDEPVTREQLALMFMKYSENILKEDVSGRADVTEYEDASEIHTWAKEGVEWAIDEGLISGKGGGIIDPRGKAMRSELAQIIYKFTSKRIESENKRSNEKLYEKWGFTVEISAWHSYRGRMIVSPLPDEGKDLPDMSMTANVYGPYGEAKNVPFDKISTEIGPYYRADKDALDACRFDIMKMHENKGPVKVDLTITVDGEELELTFFADVDIIFVSDGQYA